MKTLREHEYRVSERVVIRAGESFRAKGGPYWKSSDGTKVRLSSTGPFKFIAYVKRGAVGWIEAVDREGCFAVLHVEGRRKRIDCSLVARPYTITGKKRTIAKA